MAGRQKAAPVISLLTAATVWGLIWYPYRFLEQAGLGGIQSSVLTYLIALSIGAIVFRVPLRAARFSWWLPLIALTAGACNLGFVLAVLHGEVMRVLLLFYLSPLWTVLLARVLLGESLSRVGAMVIALSLAGAMVMLWHPHLGLSWPGNTAEWIGLAAGFFFALQNVLIRKTIGLSIEIKAVAVFVGVIVLGLALMPFAGGAAAPGPKLAHWAILIFIGVVLLSANIVVQFGLMRLAANQAIVIYLFELVVAAISSWLLAGESMGAQEWIGGAMIVAASVFSGRLAEPAGECPSSQGNI